MSTIQPPSDQLTSLPSLDPSILTPRLLLRSPQPADAAAIAALFQNPASTRFEPPRPRNPPTTGEYTRRIAKWEELRAQGTNYFMVITRRDTGAVVGIGGVNGISVEGEGEGEGEGRRRVADVGVVIDSAEWRQGFGREALVGTLDWAFGEAGCEEALMETMVENEPMKGLAEGCGLGRWMRVKNDGTECEYRVKKGEWEEIRRKME